MSPDILSKPRINPVKQVWLLHFAHKETEAWKDRNFLIMPWSAVILPAPQNTHRALGAFLKHV